MHQQPLGTLIALLQHRWSIVVLAELHRRSGSKFVSLVNILGLRRASVTASLQHLVAKGLVRRNAGYGHPLRPEYLLTTRGAALGDDCLALVRLVRAQNADRVAYRKWSLPLLLAIGKDKSRFNALRNALGGISPRAQTLALKSLEQMGWVRREIDAGYPPVATYQLSRSGQAIQAVLQRLCEH
jgi:DNA-binding HxlR family transcriptional regulator